jgi:hypothetical protein
MKSPVAQLSFEDARTADRAELQKKLQNLARELLIEDAASVRTGPTHGVTFDQVRLRAETRGWLTGQEKGRTLSFGAALMKAAGGVPCEFRASKHRNSHGRLIRVFRLAVVAGG